VPVLGGLGLRRVHTVPRWRLASPLHAFRLLRELRRERYEATIHLGLSGHSMGALLTALSGARHRIGCPGAHANVLFTSAVERPRARHRVDAILEYAGSLGAPAQGERTLVLSAEERLAARERLGQALGPAAERGVGIFVGARAHKGKQWPLTSFAALAAELRARSFVPVVFLGPEETRQAAGIQRALGEALYVQGEELRRVAALLACCRAVVTPDSGPMHLAVAVGVPTVAIFSDSDPAKWGPRPPLGEAIVDRSGHDVQAVLAALLRRLAEPPPQRPAPASSFA
jgi:heptosyltransferase-3